jgi:GH43 family beta-xylosidase
MPFRKICLFVLFAGIFFSTSFAQTATFSNPLLPSGADPFSFYKDGFYYYTHTTGKNITLWKTESIAGLKTAEKKIVFTPPAKGPYSKELWAPEIHFLQNKWYIYFAADSGNNNQHRLWVLENSSLDPLQGQWIMKGKLATPDDKWAIDGSIFENKGQLFCIWSGWEGDTNGQQNIYIAKMKNPWTVEGKRVLLSSPELDWETHGDLKSANDPPHVNVNEGPEVLVHDENLFLIYSASGCWTEYYALGMLRTSVSSDLMDPRVWKKSPQPVFKASTENKVYAPGHNSFFKSPDGKEDWILYHANSLPGQGCGGFRSPRAQKFGWDKNGFPVFDIPVSEQTALSIPSK